MAALFVTSCEDVPMPYQINLEKKPSNDIYKETFATSFGKCVCITTDGAGAWVIDYKTAKATGYDQDTKKTTAGTYYLVTPEIDLTEKDSVFATYQYILRYNKGDNNQQFLINDNYDENNPANGWTLLYDKHTEGTDWNTFSTASVNIPSQFLHKKVRMAFKYTTNDASGSTWEVKEFYVKNGVAKQDSTYVPPVGDYSIPFTSANLKDGFTTITETGAAWSLGPTYAKATGYNNNTTTATKAWLISPAINTTLKDSTTAHINFENVIRYANGGDLATTHKVLASTDFDGSNVATATWTALDFIPVESSTSDWTFYNGGDIEIPTQFLNKEKVYFAFYFECNSSNSTTWELKNLNIVEGKGTPLKPIVEEATDKAIPYLSKSLKDGYSVITETGAAWSLGNTYAKATGYDNNSKTTTATKTWLVSGAINTNVTDLSKNVYLYFDNVIRYANGVDLNSTHKVYLSTEFDGKSIDPSKWTAINFQPKESATSDWVFYTSGNINFPREFLNKEKVYVAFYFECNSSNSTTWELKNLRIDQNGAGEEKIDPIDTKTAKFADFANGDFELWDNDTQPTGWKSTNTASSAKLEKSTDAHSGQFSVKVEGASSGNKRIAYKELELEAGTYNYSFFVKSADASKLASIIPGYAYKSGDTMKYPYKQVDGKNAYLNDVPADQWTEVTGSFTLDAKTVVNFVIMNSKNPGAPVLIDDYTISKE